MGHVTQLYISLKLPTCATFCISSYKVKTYLRPDLVPTLARLDVNDFPHGELRMRAEASAVFSAGSSKSALDSFLVRLRCR